MLFYLKVSKGVVIDRIQFNEPMPDTWPERADWVEDGVGQIGWSLQDGVLYPPVVPSPPPLDPLRDLQPDQFHTMLNLSGYLPDIEAAFAAIEHPPYAAAAKAKLRYATYYSRNDPLVVDMAAVIGMAPAELDALWEYAHNF